MGVPSWSGSWSWAQQSHERVTLPVVSQGQGTVIQGTCRSRLADTGDQQPGVLAPPPVEHVGRGARFDNLTLAKDQHLVAFPRIILTAFTDATQRNMPIKATVILGMMGDARAGATSPSSNALPPSRVSGLRGTGDLAAKRGHQQDRCYLKYSTKQNSFPSGSAITTTMPSA